MNGVPSGNGVCCPPRAEGITYLKIGPRRILVGMLGLETIFQQLYAMGRRPEEVTAAELISMARQFNYIPERPTLEADYATALGEAYARFCSLRETGKGERPWTNTANRPTC
jgi:hypothetical protein